MHLQGTCSQVNHHFVQPSQLPLTKLAALEVAWMPSHSIENHAYFTAGEIIMRNTAEINMPKFFFSGSLCTLSFPS